jgi:hypothetical protein
VADILTTEFMDQGAVEDLRSGFDVDYAPDRADAPEGIPARPVQLHVDAAE